MLLSLGVIVLTLSPLLAAIVCWKLAQAARRGWIVHLIFAPGVVLAYIVSAELLWDQLRTGGSGDPFGIAVLLGPSMVSLAVAVSGYYVALTWRCVLTVVVDWHLAKSASRRPTKVLS